MPLPAPQDDRCPRCAKSTREHGHDEFGERPETCHCAVDDVLKAVVVASMLFTAAVLVYCVRAGLL